jgi:hypothetical protein
MLTWRHRMAWQYWGGPKNPSAYASAHGRTKVGIYLRAQAWRALTRLECRIMEEESG